MTFTAFFLILISAILHASWNLMSKARRPSAVFYLQASITASLLWLPLMIWGGVEFARLPGKFWLLFLASCIMEAIYYIGLANAYRSNDISLAYPMLRSLPVLLTGLLTVVFGLGTPPTQWCWLGMVLISAGCLMMPLANFAQMRWRTYFNRKIIFILIGACGTTGYTIIDSVGMGIFRASLPGSSPMVLSCLYIGMIEMMLVVILSGLILASPVERREFRGYFGRSGYPILAGVCSSTAYALILFAMGFVSNVSYVQAFRQMSLPICMLAGVFWLGEKLTPPRMAGFCAVIIGLLLTILR